MTALTREEILDRISAELPRWSYEDGMIRRKWRMESWATTLLATNAVAHLAERADHHPDIAIGYGRLEVRLSTHDASGVTDKDFALARQIDALLD